MFTMLQGTCGRMTVGTACHRRSSCTAGQLTARQSVFAGARLQLCTQQRASQAASPNALVVVAAGKYKLKTRKAAAKRFKVSAGGKVMIRHPGKQHINEKKSSARLSKLSKEHQASNSDVDNIKGCLPYAKIKRQ